MIDKTAIEAIAQAQAIKTADDAVTNALQAKGALALPEQFKVIDLEKFMPHRRHQSGSMGTDSTPDFSAYVAHHAEDGCTVFVSKEHMSATAVLNLGHKGAPGHCDNTAKLKLTARAEYVALSQIVGQSRSQQTIAEFLEDWQHLITCFAENNELGTSKAIAAVRNITIEAARKVESEEQQLGATRSSLESVTATSKHTLPTHIYFECEPYAGLQKRTFVLRLGIQTGDKEPRIVLRIVKSEEHAQDMAEEFAGTVRDALAQSVIPVLIGAYAKN